MLNKQTKFSKRRWLFTLCGLIFYVADISTDILLALKYFKESQYVWSGMTVVFVLTGLLVTQTFSCVWYREDVEKKNMPGVMSRGKSTALHILGLGIFMRYFELLKEGFNTIWKNEKRRELFDMAADLSMLKLFETYLESAPQLLLQLYVRGQNEWQILQIMSLAFSFCNMAWSLVDFRLCLRNSLPNSSSMPSGLHTVVYLLYKLGTITSLVLSYSFLLTLSVYSTVLITIFWLVLTTWVHFLETNFCSSKVLELLYRAVTGVILIFSFFNVKGKNTRIPMTVYYITHSVVCTMAPILLAFLKPEMQTTIFLWAATGVIYIGLSMGLLCLVLYYRYLHSKKCEQDEVDGHCTTSFIGIVMRNGTSIESTNHEAEKENATARRLRTFLQP